MKRVTVGLVLAFLCLAPVRSLYAQSDGSLSAAWSQARAWFDEDLVAPREGMRRSARVNIDLSYGPLLADATAKVAERRKALDRFGIEPLPEKRLTPLDERALARLTPPQRAQRALVEAIQARDSIAEARERDLRAATSRSDTRYTQVVATALLIALIVIVPVFISLPKRKRRRAARRGALVWGAAVPDKRSEDDTLSYRLEMAMALKAILLEGLASEIAPSQVTTPGNVGNKGEEVTIDPSAAFPQVAIVYYAERINWAVPPGPMVHVSVAGPDHDENEVMLARVHRALPPPWGTMLPYEWFAPALRGMSIAVGSFYPLPPPRA